MRIGQSVGDFAIVGPKPRRVEYPYGLPGDGFRRHAKSLNATCVAYHMGVDPHSLAHLRNGNDYRYGTDDPRHLEMVEDMRNVGYRGGPGQRLIIHVTHDDAWFAEGNHRMRAALEAGLTSVEIEIRYLCNADEKRLLIPFDVEDTDIRVISD